MLFTPIQVQTGMEITFPDQGSVAKYGGNKVRKLQIGFFNHTNSALYYRGGTINEYWIPDLISSIQYLTLTIFISMQVL